MDSINLIVKFPLRDLQTEKAQNMDITITDCCCICGKKLKNSANTKMVQLLTSGNIVSTDQDIENSQGFFSVGSECLKKLVIKFTF